jgi:hypothetical protein
MHAIGEAPLKKQANPASKGKPSKTTRKANPAQNPPTLPHAMHQASNQKQTARLHPDN